MPAFVSVRPRHLAIVALLASLQPGTPATAADDLAARFGARPAVAHASLSADGNRLAFIAPAKGQGGVLNTVELSEGSAPKPIYAVDGDPQRLAACPWVTAERLVCTIWGIVSDGNDLYDAARLVALNRDGSNARMLSAKQSTEALGYDINGGNIIDWLPDGNAGQVLMTRVRVEEATTGRLAASKDHGLGVEKVDTATLRSTMVERPEDNAREYITDGRGNVRIMGPVELRGDGYYSGLRPYFYRKPGSREWLPLSVRNELQQEGFDPYAVDAEQNVAYGFDKLDGRQVLYKVALDGSATRTLVLARDGVDVDGLIQLGSRQRIVGASFTTDRRQVEYFDPAIRKLHAGLTKAVPDHPLISIVDASVDEQKLLIFASADDRPGTWFLMDRAARSLRPLLETRPQLNGITLAKVQSITYPAADGTMVPGYLTLPPGKTAKGLPAIVLPHGGPSARDEWGFDWLSQYYAAMGYAVLQPNFRGSAGYGDAWLQINGLQSWKIAIGDVSDAGRWLVKEGIADPKQLGIVGWSYGGYAALQSAVVDPSLFKAVVAIAPVTDLTRFKDQYRRTSSRVAAFDFIGAGPHITEGSPAQRAAEIKVPVLLFHGALDTNVDIAHSRLMADKLTAARVPHRLVTWDGLDHYLEDSDARTRMLRESEAFLQAAFKGQPVP